LRKYRAQVTRHSFLYGSLETLRAYLIFLNQSAVVPDLVRLHGDDIQKQPHGEGVLKMNPLDAHRGNIHAVKAP